jgi:L-rhamnose mutarotase
MPCESVARGIETDQGLQNRGLWVSLSSSARITYTFSPAAFSLLFLTSENFPDSIFHDEATGILFASFKYVGYNWEGDMEKMRENPKVREWWRMTDGYQESMVPGAVSSEAGEPSWWKGLEEVFYYDGATQ